MKTFSFVAASSNSGKTMLLEKVVRILKGRGLRVAVIKHASKGFELDRPGKDSWRFQRAGADLVLLAGPGQIALIERIDRELSAEELARRAGSVDIVLFEGFKRDASAKIEVFRSGVSGERPLCLDDPSFIALVSDTPWNVNIPQFSPDDAESVAGFVIGECNSANSGC